MAIEKLGTEWEMVGLRITVKEDGHVEFDMVRRLSGCTQIIMPMASVNMRLRGLTPAVAERIESTMLEAVRQLITDMLQ